MYMKKQFNLIKEFKTYTDGWDSYDGNKPKAESLSLSEWFLLEFDQILKNKCPSYCRHYPEFSLAPDGVLGFEWDYAPDKNLFARLHSIDKVEVIIREKTSKSNPKVNIVDRKKFIQICKDKLKECEENIRK